MEQNGIDLIISGYNGMPSYKNMFTAQDRKELISLGLPKGPSVTICRRKP